MARTSAAAALAVALAGCAQGAPAPTPSPGGTVPATIGPVPSPSGSDPAAVARSWQSRLGRLKAPGGVSVVLLSAGATRVTAGYRLPGSETCEGDTAELREQVAAALEKQLGVPVTAVCVGAVKHPQTGGASD